MTLTDEVTKVREHQASMKADLTWVKKEQTEQNKKLDTISNSLNSFIKTADGKYASKKVVDDLTKKVQNNDTTIQKWSAIIAFVVVVASIIINILF